MNTQARKTRAGWLSLGWLTDAQLAKDLKEYQALVSDATGVHVALSECVKTLLKAGLGTVWDSGSYRPKAR